MKRLKIPQRVVVAFGCNIGNCKRQIETALRELEREVKLLKVSNIMLSEPYGVKEQPPFHNGVLVGYTKLPPLELLRFLKSVERKVGRKKRCRWCEREIDLDIVYYGNLTFKSEELTIPHPDRLNRVFVLKPLWEIEPTFIDPVVGKSAAELLKRLKGEI